MTPHVQPHRDYVDRISGFARSVFRRLARTKCHAYLAIEPFITGKVGLEIGGPSPIFRSGRLIPVYDRCQRIDGCNFATRTIWGNAHDSSGFGLRFGRYYTAEASEMLDISSEAYDFVLASHVLEHIANPLRAVDEWNRVLAPGGVLLVIVPDKRWTFDHRRAYTSFEHLEANFRSGISEGDLTHLDEILSLHDLRLDPPAGSPEQFRQRCLNNYSVRGMHHHVFSPEVLAQVLTHSNMRLLSLAIERPHHLIAFAQKAAFSAATDDSR